MARQSIAQRGGGARDKRRQVTSGEKEAAMPGTSGSTCLWARSSSRRPSGKQRGSSAALGQFPPRATRLVIPLTSAEALGKLRFTTPLTRVVCAFTQD